MRSTRDFVGVHGASSFQALEQAIRTVRAQVRKRGREPIVRSTRRAVPAIGSRPPLRDRERNLVIGCKAIG
jgi:hypothetical protein